MTLPVDSLEAALWAVPCRYCLDPLSAHTKQSCWRWSPEEPALATAVREWIRHHLPMPFLGHPGSAAPGAECYNAALADVARRLGLTK